VDHEAGRAEVPGIDDCACGAKERGDGSLNAIQKHDSGLTVPVNVARGGLRVLLMSAGV
jgi:hypothetical protein